MSIKYFKVPGKRKIVLLLLFSSIWASKNLLSQQSPSFSQFSFDSYLINPAIAGSEGYTTISLVAREQWVRISGTPKTHAINFQTRIFNKSYKPTHNRVRRRQVKLLRGGKVGIGFNLIDDRAGVFNRTSLKFAYAFHIVRLRAQYSFGLGMSISQLKINFNKVRLEDSEDNSIYGSSASIYTPDFNLGFNYLKDNLFAGFSIDNIMKVVSFGYGSKNNSTQRLLNLLGGITFDISRDLQMEPSLYLKSDDLTAFQGEINLKLIFEKNYWAACTYRTLKSTSIQFGFKINRFYFGYAYDYNFIALQMNSFGTHELMLALKLGDNSRRYRWLQRY